MIGRGLVLVMLLQGCRTDATDPRPLPIEVIVEGDSGERLGGVPIRVDGELVGQSNANGVLQTSVVGTLGEEVRVSQDCPNDHRKVEDTAPLRIRRYEMPGSAAPLRVILHCRPELRIAALVVSTGSRSGVVVQVDGEMVATTDDRGIVHLSRRVPPGTELLVELDASRYPRLRPQRTSRVLRVSDSHEIFVIDQQYERARRAHRRPATRRRIIKIE